MNADADGTGLALAVIDLDGDTLQEAEIIRERNAIYAKYAWWISAALFALGWGLGLLGKLKGVPGCSVSRFRRCLTSYKLTRCHASDD